MPPPTPKPLGSPIVLAAIEDRLPSLSSLLLAADIARVNGAELHVVHVRRPYWMWPTPGLVVPPSTWEEAARDVENQLRTKVSDLLALAAPVEWWFTSTAGSPSKAIADIARQEHPIAVVVGAPRHRWLRVNRSVTRSLIGRAGLPAVITPA